MRPLRDVLKELPTSLESGLSEPGVALSRERFGVNRLTPLPREPLWRKFLAKLDEPIIRILLAAAFLSMLVDLFQPPWERGRLAAGLSLIAVTLAVCFVFRLRGGRAWIPSILFVAALLLFAVGSAVGHASWDGLAVMIAVILATGVAFLSEYKSDREFELLNAEKESLRAKVVRAGQFHTLPLEGVLAGDLVLLEVGDEIPADGRVLKATEFYVDQSLMTGESEPARKHPSAPDDARSGPDHVGCVYRGTQVVDGVGAVLVTEVGDATYLGQIARRLSSPHRDSEAADERIQHKLTLSRELTPLQRKLERLAGLISKVGYVAAAAIFVALIIQGLIRREIYWPESAEDVSKVAGRLVRDFMYMVIVIVVAVPEGLPMSVTVSLALAMRKMTRANSLVRQLVACETIGSTTVICSDKTGTLTQNKMQVVRLSWDGQTCDRETPGWIKPESPSLAGSVKPLEWLVLNAAVNSTANLEAKGDRLVPIGNSTEGALLLWLHEAGLEYETLRLQSPELYQVHFSSERKRMTTVVRHGARLVALVKGAPEWLLERSTGYLRQDGSISAWTEECKQATRARLAEAAAQAMRTLAFGHALLPVDTPDDEDGLHDRRDRLEEGLTFDGFVAIRDPLREDVRDALTQCRDAGIDVKMITGDNVETARAIGREVGLLDRSNSLVLTSAEFNAFADEKLKERLPHLRIVARAQPLDKLRLVRLLQELGAVVAVTGDGTNDAPALKQADVGLAMGRTGTEVAKEASKIVLLDDSFATIVKAVHWGRALYENIQRFLQFQLTINVSALVIAFLGPFLGVRPPFTVLQLLWINVIMDTFASIALCSEPPRPGLMAMPPKRRDENILTPVMLMNIFTTSAFFIVVMLGLLLGLRAGWFAGDGARAADFPELTLRQVAIFFTAYVFFQVWNEVNCRSLTPEISGLRGLLANRTFLAIIGLTVALQMLIVTFGGQVFQVEPLGWRDWLLIFVATSSVLIFAEVVRRIRLAKRWA